MITTAIYTMLMSSTDITDIIGDNLFPQIAPQSASMPFVVYEIDSVTPNTTKDGPSILDEYSINFICFGNDYDVLFTLNTAIRSKLDRYKGTVDTTCFDQVNFKGSNTGYDNKANVNIIESNFNFRAI